MLLNQRLFGLNTVLVFILLMCLASCAAGGVSCRFEQAPTTELQAPCIVIPHITKAPKIDGVLKSGEWDKAESTTSFVKLGTREAPALPTKAWLAVDGKHLYAAFRCDLAPGIEPKAAAKDHDGRVWEDDSVELYIWPDVSKKDYYQFIINCVGTTLDTILTSTAPSDVKVNFNWNPKFTLKTGRDKSAWTLEMAVPLSAISLKPQSPHFIRLNMCRNIQFEGWKIACWANLSTIEGGIHKRLHEFGAGICTFRKAKGACIDAAKVTGLKDFDFLNASNPDRLVMLPGDYSITVTPKTAFPTKLMTDTKYLLQASICPMLTAEKEGKPTTLGKTYLKSSSSVKATVKGLQPGDYKLKLTCTGPGVSSSTERPIMVRAPHVEPEITGSVVFDDCDWRSSGSVAKTIGIEHKLTSELLLQTQYKTPVLAFDPTDDETITCMTGFQDKLYVGSCTQPAVTDTGSVYTYDPDNNIWRKAFQVNEQGLVEMGVFGDKLYIPGYDANDGGWDLGNIYINDGKNWVEKRTVPRAIHIYGLVVYHDRIYVSADILDSAPEGMSVDEAANKNLIKVYGRVVSSGDGGETWREEYRGKRNDQDVGFMTVFQDKIILNASNDIIIFDGKTWTSLGLNPAVIFAYDYGQEGNTLMLGTQHGVFYFDGNRFWKSSRVWPGYIRSMTKFGDKWVLTGYSLPDNTPGRGPGCTRYPQLKEKDSPHVYPNLALFSPDLILEPPDATDWGSDKLWKQYKWIGCHDTCVSSTSFRGRLYLGTHPEGRVLVLPVCASGTLVSKSHKLERSGTYHLWWDAATPSGTSVSLQVRTAASIEELEKEQFTGPDGTSKSYFHSQGSSIDVKEPGFIQYRLILKTSDPAKTPYVKRIVLTE